MATLGFVNRIKIRGCGISPKSKAENSIILP